MENVRIENPNDLEVKKTIAIYKATQEEILFFWQWLPEKLTVKISFDEDRNWQVLDSTDYKCRELS